MKERELVMGAYEKAKSFANSFFNGFEVGLVNFAVRRLYIWRLKHRYMLKTDYISPEFKKEVIEYWKKYTKKPK